MGLIVKPNTFVPGTVIRSAEVNDNFDVIYNEFNGNINEANLTTLTGTVTWSLGTNVSAIAITKGAAGAGSLIDLTNAGTDPTIKINTTGTGLDIRGTATTWQVTKAGAATFASITVGSINSAGDISADGNIKWKSGTANYATLDHANAAPRTYTYPDADGHVPILPNPATTETGSGAIVRASSPTIATPTIADFTNANHNHENAAGGGQLSITAATTGTLPVTRGGTGLITVVQGDILYASAADTLSRLAKDANATRYLSNTGAGNNPAWAQVDLTNGVTGVLPVANGGTGVVAAFTAGSVIFSDGTKLDQDNANFFWDNANNRLGIGTNSPLRSLHISGSNVSQIFLQDTNAAAGSQCFRINSIGGSFNIQLGDQATGGAEGPISPFTITRSGTDVTTISQWVNLSGGIHSVLADVHRKRTGNNTGDYQEIVFDETIANDGTTNIGSFTVSDDDGAIVIIEGVDRSGGSHATAVSRQFAVYKKAGAGNLTWTAAADLSVTANGGDTGLSFSITPANDTVDTNTVTITATGSDSGGNTDHHFVGVIRVSKTN